MQHGFHPVVSLPLEIQSMKITLDVANIPCLKVFATVLLTDMKTQDQQGHLVNTPINVISGGDFPG